MHPWEKKRKRERFSQSKYTSLNVIQLTNVNVSNLLQIIIYDFFFVNNNKNHSNICMPMLNNVKFKSLETFWGNECLLVTNRNQFESPSDELRQIKMDTWKHKMIVYLSQVQTKRACLNFFLIFLIVFKICCYEIESFIHLVRSNKYSKYFLLLS